MPANPYDQFDAPASQARVANPYDQFDPDAPSYEGGVVRAAAQGLTFGFGDELEAAAKWLGGSDYWDELKRARRKIERFRKDHPYVSMGAELIGGAAVPLGGITSSVARNGLRMGTLARDAAAIGAPMGAAYGVGTAEDISSPEQAVAPAMEGAMMGGLGYLIGAPVVHGLARGGRAIANSVADAVDPAAAAARKSAEAVGQSGMSVDDLVREVVPRPAPRVQVPGQPSAAQLEQSDVFNILRRAAAGESPGTIAADYNIAPGEVTRYMRRLNAMGETPMNVIDIAQDIAAQQGRTGGADPVVRLGRAAVAVSRDANVATERLAQRQVDQGGRLMGELERAGLPPGGADSAIDDLQRVIDTQGSQAYRQAHANNPQVSLGAQLRRMRRQIDTRAGEIRSGMQSALNLFYRNGRPISSLREYHDARMALDQMIEGSRGQLGRRTPLTRQLTAMRRRLNDQVRRNNPDLAAADDLFAENRGAQALIERGMQIATKAGNRRSMALIREMQTMTPEQREAVRTGFLQKLANDVENKRPGHDIAAQFTTPAGTNLIREIVGGQEAERLITAIRREGLTTKTFRELYSGSRTAPLLEDMAAFEDNMRLAAATLTGNVQGVMSALSARLRRHLGSRQSREVLNLLTETDRVRLLDVLQRLQEGARASEVRDTVTGFLRERGGKAGALLATKIGGDD